MHQYKSILFYGFVIFAMFFGSGNLALPMQIGFLSGENWLIGFLGILLTGVVLPFLGLLVIKLYKGDYMSFFGEAGVIAKVCLPFFTLSLLGPFGVIPRCIVVAQGGIQYLLPDISLVEFSLFFSVVTFCLCIKDKIMIHILGKYLSPIKLITLITLIIFGVIYTPSIKLESTEVMETLKMSTLTAYQTMDLFAAFFFSSVIFKQIQDHLPNNTSDREVLSFSIKAGVVGFSLLALIYLGLVYLSAHYAFLLNNISPKKMLPVIAMHTMGNAATIVISCAMFFSCLATAITLSNIYAKYICDLLRLNSKRFPIVLAVSIIVSFVMSLLDFSGIAAFLVPMLEVSYPGLIVLTIMGICFRKTHKIKMYLFWVITIVMLLQSI